MSELKPCPIDLMKIRALCYDGAFRAYVEGEYIYLKDIASGEIVWIGDTAQPANDPLTLEQLREMGGEPVFIILPNDVEDNQFWIIRHEWTDTNMCGRPALMLHMKWYLLEDCGKTWIAYRRPPEMFIGVDLASGHDFTAYGRPPERSGNDG